MPESSTICGTAAIRLWTLTLGSLNPTLGDHNPCRSTLLAVGTTVALNPCRLITLASQTTTCFSATSWVVVPLWIRGA